MPPERSRAPDPNAVQAARILVGIPAASIGFVALKSVVLHWVAPPEHGPVAAGLALVLAVPATYVMIRRSEAPPRPLAAGASLLLGAALAGVAFLLETW